MSESLSGYYGSKRVSGTTYRLFHRKKVMKSQVLVVPSKQGHYRVRADYLNGKDTSNLGNDSAWQYFIVEK